MKSLCRPNAFLSYSVHGCDKMPNCAAKASKEGTKYDSYAVPSFFADGEKLFEAYLGMSYEEIKAQGRKVLDLARK